MEMGDLYEPDDVVFRFFGHKESWMAERRTVKSPTQGKDPKCQATQATEDFASRFDGFE
jgi:hypothetical protein